jgi:class 3 adenylate cyclase
MNEQADLVRGAEDDVDHRSRMYAAGLYWYVGAAASHALLIPLFYFLDRPVLAVFNIASTAIFVACTWLQKRDHASSAFMLASIEICVHAILSTLLLGMETGFFFYILLLSGIAILGPLKEMRLRIFSSAMFAGLAAVLCAYVLANGADDPLGFEWTAVFLIANILLLVLFLAVILRSYDHAVSAAETALQMEHGRSEALLDNIMPPEVSARLKQGEEPIADSHPQVTVLFADIVGFTERSASMPPERLIELLNNAFTRFDQLVERYDLEKIKTIGDAYMVVGGVPQARDDHAQAVAGLALDMIRASDEISRTTGEPFSVRIGINSGPVVAGVIGETKLAYDLWGDVVNTASRMESHGEPGKVQITSATRELLDGSFACEPREGVDIKGKGVMTTYYLGAPGQ